MISRWARTTISDPHSSAGARFLTDSLKAIDASLAAEAGHGVPRISMLETEYQRSVLAAESAWVDKTVKDLQSGGLDWSVDELMAFAQSQEDPEGEPSPG